MVVVQGMVENHRTVAVDSQLHQIVEAGIAYRVEQH